MPNTSVTETMIRLRASDRSTVADQGAQANHGDRAEQQAEDAAHDRYRNAQQAGAELADEGQGDGKDRRPVMIFGL